MRVANTYFTPETRAVAIYYRDESTPDEPDDPLVEGLSPEERQQFQQMRAMIGQVPVEQLQAFLAQAEQAVGQAPPESQDLARALVELVRRRIEESGGGQ